jgi:hypothetical protein
MSLLVLPTLTAWTSSRLTTILSAKNSADFTTAFDATFARNVNVTFNGKHLSREQYQAQLLSQSSAAPGEEGASVSVQGQLEVQGDQGQFVIFFFFCLFCDLLNIFSVWGCRSILHIAC